MSFFPPRVLVYLENSSDALLSVCDNAHLDEGQCHCCPESLYERWSGGLAGREVGKLLSRVGSISWRGSV